MRQWLIPRFHGGLGAVVAALSGVAPGGCIVEDSRCGENQVLDQQNPSLCHCAANTVLNPRGYGCDKCGENQIAVANNCVCNVGYVQESAGGPCVKSSMSMLGYPCSESEPCTEPYPYCATAGGISFCTTPGGCTVNADCPTNLVCFAEGDTRFCGRVSGLGEHCDTPGDCAGTLSTYCEGFSTHLCLMEGCVTDLSMCPSGWSCCDLTSFIQTSICVLDTVLTNGKCADGSPPLRPPLKP